MLRNYKENTTQSKLYKDMYNNQTLEFVKEKKNNFKSLKNGPMDIKTVLENMNDFIDPSDPDLDEENIIHAYQTAEKIRMKDPLNKELQIVGLIHDLGKILFKFNYPSWSIVGDTFITGCEYPKSLVYYNEAQKTTECKKYMNNKLGIYKEKCGLENLHISIGHDEYLYQVLNQNKDKHKLSNDSINIIRYHSFYPWHSFNEYSYFMNEDDYKTLENVKNFNSFDLYSKEDKNFKITREMKNYYEKLLDEYFKEPLIW